MKFYDKYVESRCVWKYIHKSLVLIQVLMRMGVGEHVITWELGNSQWCREFLRLCQTHCFALQPSTSITIRSQLSSIGHSWHFITGGKEYYFLWYFATILCLLQTSKKKKKKKKELIASPMPVLTALYMYMTWHFIYSVLPVDCVSFHHCGATYHLTITYFGFFLIYFFHQYYEHDYFYNNFV